MIVRDWVLYASDDSPESVKEAREYIKAQGFTADDVRLIKVDGQVRVVAKRMPESWV